VFPSGVLFLAYATNREFLDEQRRVRHAVEDLMVDPWVYFTPGRWTPHITLGMGYTSEQVARALPAVLARPSRGCPGSRRRRGRVHPLWPICSPILHLEPRDSDSAIPFSGGSLPGQITLMLFPEGDRIPRWLAHPGGTIARTQAGGGQDYGKLVAVAEPRLLRQPLVPPRVVRDLYCDVGLAWGAARAPPGVGPTAETGPRHP
jgi:hypothetical protein